MNDQDYIRKAVELADGWHLNGEAFGTPNDGPDLDDIKNITQQDKDALAAQLVRQLDASNSCSLFVHPPVGDSPGYARILGVRELKVRKEGDDRTMNTIKAIVDSGVLKDHQ